MEHSIGSIASSHDTAVPPHALEQALPAVSALKSHPQFAAVAREATLGLVRSYRGSAVMNRLLNDRGRFLLSMLMMAEYFEVPREQGGGLNASRLKAEALELGICSAGRTGAVLGAFRLLGLIEVAPASDRRLKPLAPTRNLINMHCMRWRALFEPMAAILPEGTIGLTRLDDTDFVSGFVQALVKPFREGWRLVDDAPGLAPFVDRDAGVVIACALLETAHGEPPQPIAHLARQFGVSRSHVIRVFQAGEEAGLISRFDARGGATAQPSLVDALHDFMASAFLAQARAVRAACAGMPFKG